MVYITNGNKANQHMVTEGVRQYILNRKNDIHTHIEIL